MGSGRRAGASTTVAATVAGLVTACATPAPPGPSTVAGGKPVPVASTDMQVEEAKQAALAAYAGYLAASRKASEAADPHLPELREHLGDPLLTTVRLTIRNLRDAGAVRTGAVVSDPTVTDVNLTAVPATVSIQDCIDTTGYRMIYKKDKKTVPGSGGGRYVATATAARYPDGRWLINQGAAHPDQPC